MLLGPASGASDQRLGVGGDGLVGEPSFNVFGQVSRGGVAGLGLQSHGLQADGFEGRVEPRGPVARSGESPFFHPSEDLADVRADERRAGGQDRVERGAEAVNIAGWAEEIQASHRLLGAHVAGRSNERAGNGFGGAASHRR